MQTISLIALTVASAYAVTAHAQDAAPQEAAQSSGGLQDIVVTARKVNESQQRVPVAVTVQSGEALRQQSAVTVPDIGRLTPGITFAAASQNSAAATLTIRGQVQTDVLATLDPSVGVYVDDFYWARAYGLNTNLLDIESAQVLRGPQGTLFGRNTTGGALLLQSNNPNYDGISGSVSGTYGRFNEVSGTGVLNLPIVTDKIALRGAVTYFGRDGFSRNELTGRRLGEQDSYTGRLKLRLDPTDTLQVILSGEWYGAKFYDRPYELIYVAPNSAANLESAFSTYGPGDPAQRTGEGQALFNDYIASIKGDRVRLNDFDPRVDIKTQTYVLTTNLDTDFGAVKFVGGYRKIRSNASVDLDGSPWSIIQTEGNQDLESYSGELQATGKAFNDALDFAVGYFYFRETGRDESTSIALPTLTRLSSGGLLPRTFYIGDVDNQSMGAYFQGTWRFSDAFSFTGGVRYSAEDKNIVAFNQTRNADTDALLSCLIATADPVTCRLASNNSFEGVSYTAGLNYQVNRDVLVYAKTSKGFRSGGQNLRASGSSGSAFAPFGPEVVYEEEVGLKSELFNRRVRFNLAAFYSEVSDIQRTSLVVSPGGGATSTVVANAGKARFYGGEAELTVRAAEGLTLTGNAALTNAKYLAYADATGDRRDEAFQGVPQWTFSVAADYNRPLPSGTLRAHIDYAWRDDVALSNYRTRLTGNAAQDAIIQTVAKAQTTPAGGEVNGRLSFGMMDDRLEIAAFGRNILNRRVYSTGLFFEAPLSVAVGKRNEPATYGIQATFRFGQ
ncbi:MAG: TonB-dependent receptor [Sphingobium sp.]